MFFSLKKVKCVYYSRLISFRPVNPRWIMGFFVYVLLHLPATVSSEVPLGLENKCLKETGFVSLTLCFTPVFYVECYSMILLHFLELKWSPRKR